jgi:DNA invertase Pin-like site-specific DNA recombinase
LGVPHSNWSERGSIMPIDNPSRTTDSETSQIELRVPIMFLRAYLRASTKEQDAARARADLEAFAAERGLTIASSYLENESGASLQRPELFRLLADSKPGDVLLIEQVDRLSRLNAADWERLKAEIAAKRVRVVALDLPTSYQLAQAGDDFTTRMLDAINGMMLDMLAAIARKDYEDRRRRQAQGIAKAKDDGKYAGRPEDAKRNAAIIGMLRAGQSWTSIIDATKCSRSTLARLAKRLGQEVAS